MIRWTLFVNALNSTNMGILEVRLILWKLSKDNQTWKMSKLENSVSCWILQHTQNKKLGKLILFWIIDCIQTKVIIVINLWQLLAASQHASDILLIAMQESSWFLNFPYIISLCFFWTGSSSSFPTYSSYLYFISLFPKILQSHSMFHLQLIIE